MSRTTISIKHGQGNDDAFWRSVLAEFCAHSQLRFSATDNRVEITGTGLAVKPILMALKGRAAHA